MFLRQRGFHLKGENSHEVSPPDECCCYFLIFIFKMRKLATNKTLFFAFVLLLLDLGILFLCFGGIFFSQVLMPHMSQVFQQRLFCQSVIFHWRSRASKHVVIFAFPIPLELRTCWFSTQYFQRCSRSLSFHVGWRYCEGWLPIPHSTYNRCLGNF